MATYGAEVAYKKKSIRPPNGKRPQRNKNEKDNAVYAYDVG